MRTTSSTGARGAEAGFTLLELILVMAVLAAALGVAAPSLSNFFAGRTLGEETRRLMALTRHGAAQAVSEGIPMTLWLAEEEGEYGLRPAFAWPTNRANHIRYRLRSGISLETEPLPSHAGLFLPNAAPEIRFLPDGSVGLGSIGAVVLSDGREGRTRIALSPWRLRYQVEDPDSHESQESW